MKQRMMILGISMLLALGTFGCGKESSKTSYEQGLEVISLMTEMAGSDAYANIFSTNEEIQNIIKSAGKGDFSSPKAVYKITLTDETFSLLTESSDIKNAEDLSDALKDYVRSRLNSTITAQINAMGGAATLAASSICTSGKVFVDTSLTENAIYLYTYENAMPVAVSFTVGDDGAVMAAGNFIFYEGFDADTEQDVKDFLEEFSVEVETVTK